MRKVSAALFTLLALAALTARAGETLTVYSGRSEELVGPILAKFREASGVDLRVRYGQTAEMAATILEEGGNSPCDLFLAQDAGALGSLAREGRFDRLPDNLLLQVPEQFRSPKGLWVGITGRLRTLVYNTQKLKAEDLPDDIWGLCDPTWKGRIGWAPANGSFQAFVTALRAMEGEDRAREWLERMQKNAPVAYPKNTPIVAAVGAGEIDVGLVNHYYLLRIQDEQGASFPAANYVFRGGGPGAMINVAGAGILKSSRNKEGAKELISFLLDAEAQRYFASKDYEYPLTGIVGTDARLPSLEDARMPPVDLGRLDDLPGTLKLLQELGIL